MSIRTVVWGENIHERTNAVVGKLYPKGMHEAIADLLRQDDGIDVSTATMEQPEHGLPQSRLEATDVLLWWGHKDHGGVSDDVVERVAKRVWEGMGLIVLHSAHFSKIFQRLMGSPCALKWREAGERERLWVTAPGHPIARGPAAVFRTGERGDVWRAFLGSRAARDSLHLLVPGWRGVPLRSHLSPRCRQHLLFPSWSRNLSDLP